MSVVFFRDGGDGDRHVFTNADLLALAAVDEAGEDLVVDLVWGGNDLEAGKPYAQGWKRLASTPARRAFVETCLSGELLAAPSDLLALVIYGTPDGVDLCRLEGSTAFSVAPDQRDLMVAELRAGHVAVARALAASDQALDAAANARVLAAVRLRAWRA